MAKITAPFLIQGTIDNLNFFVTAEGKNYVRLKREGSLTTEEFNNNPIYDRIRNHGKEFGHCVNKSKIFRQLTHHFNKVAKDGSYAGRVNKLLFEIIKEDITQPIGERTLTQGLKTNAGKEALLFFESNKLRPLRHVLEIKEFWEQESYTLKIPDLLVKEHLDWPKEATHVHFTAATANWDFENDTFNTSYSKTTILEKESLLQTLILTNSRPSGNHLHLTFLFIGFAKKERNKYNFLHRKYNTTSIINVCAP